MKKTVSGVLCFLPLVLFAFTMISYFLVTSCVDGSQEFEGVLAVFAILVLVVELLMVILTYGVMIWLMIVSCKRTDFTTGNKIVWCIKLYFLHMFIFPVYWFRYMRKD